MKIVADQYIPGLPAAFADVAELTLLDPAAIDRASLHDADALLVRTVTRVDAALLAGTPVRFVGTATSGCDHVDRDYLDAHDIGFADVAGCNARPVAEYVLSALGVLSEQRGCRLADLSVAIIGCGHVGGQLRAFLQALGVTCLCNDPPLAEQAGTAAGYCDLATALTADVISLHVPLTDEGPHATRHLLTSDRLADLRDGAIVINTARGEVIDERALKAQLHERRLTAAIDVWQNEPAIDIGLAADAAIATPHIAGYSLDAKLRASNHLRQAFAEHFGQAPGAAQPPPPALQTLSLDADDLDELVRLAVLTSYDVRADAVALQRLAAIHGERSAYFAGLRQDYALRREFSSLRLHLRGGARDHAATLRQLGFAVEAN
ncbi:erythronate-4-phosphate dehydrogenase [Methylohalomonas lacus]|uniref:Erythronate-4-phosphate dehydrogenase n=1 Tax=Methylohalomonas lacus TaxID=398773 RepID=A0AAE3HJJ9_9GAMM|nr:4-phosphoerythronate dehydrogenase [Methylohalomonas lacus]MCS3902219.1 erythronate-4-phosphate dehydrogenase [Methylohalomonas lacus]